MFDTNSSRVGFEPLRKIAAADIPAAFTVLPDSELGTPVQHAIRAIKIYNNTNQPVEFSYNGVDAQDYAPATSGFTWDFATNRMDPAGIFQFPRFTQIYIRYETIAPTTGNVVVVVIYGAVN
jgi:hypothetical protein